MQFTRDVNWTASDFLLFGFMLLAVGVPLELAARYAHDRHYVAGAALALFGAFLLTWANLAVGIVGSEHSPSNMLFFVVLLASIGAAAVSRFRSLAMSRAMIGTALALALAFGIAVSLPTDEPQVSHLREFAGTSVFAALFLLAAWFFRRAARG